MYFISVFQYICVLYHSKDNMCLKLSQFVTLSVCFMPELSFLCVLCLFEQKLLDWINHVLTNDGIIVMNIEKDLFDGQILQKLIGENLPPRQSNTVKLFISMLIFMDCQFLEVDGYKIL